MDQNNWSSNLAALLEVVPRGKGIVAKTLKSIKKVDYNWDPWVLKDGDLYRMFYLRSPKPDPSVPWWSQGKIYGAISTDLKHWQSTGVMLEPDSNNLWESGRMLAGSIYKENNVYYLFYSASGGGELLGDERLAIATSEDGYTWKRFSKDSLFSPEERGVWYGANQSHFHWRDPYIFKDPKTNKYCLFICAYHKGTSQDSRFRACVALAVADRVTGPYSLMPAITAPTFLDSSGWAFSEMERPQIIYRHGKYHLFFSSWPWNVNPYWVKKLGSNRITCSTLYWFVADDIAGPYKPAQEIPIVKGSEKTGIYGTNFLQTSTNPEKLIAIGWSYRLHVLHVSPTYEVRWQSEAPEIVRTTLWL